MKALRIAAPGRTEICELPAPEPGAADVLLRVAKVGLCGSDLATYQGRNPMVAYPRVPGHEIAATVERTGADVPESIRPGAQVTVLPYTNCGRCSSCSHGRPNACKNNQTMGVQRDGALTQFISVPWRKVIAGANLTLEQLALVEPLTVGFHAVDRAKIDQSDSVVVFGCGMIGLGAIAGASHRGARAIAVDIDDQKLAVAALAGAAHGVNSATANLHEELQRLTEGAGPDVVIEAVGHPATYRAAVDEVAFAGRVVCIGYAKDDVSFATKLFVQKELDIRGSRNATPGDFQSVRDYLASGAFPLDRTITRTVSIERAGDALCSWAEAPGAVTKIVVDLLAGGQ